MSGRYSQKFLDHAKQSGIDAFKTAPKKVIQKAAEITGDLIGNKAANKIDDLRLISLYNNGTSKKW